jgi:hypothetical protein
MREVSSNGMKLTVSIIMTLTLITGCLGSDDSGSDNDMTDRYLQDTFEMDGHLDGWAQASPETISEEVHFEVPSGSVSRIVINVTVEDGNENTGVDTVDKIRMWRETGEEPSDIKEADGGDTPYHTSIEFEYSREDDGANWWIVEVTSTLIAGEDQWIGPFIWQGVTDDGVDFHIDASIEYLIISNE